MKINVCDVCYRTENGKLSKSEWRIRFKSIITFHACDDHKDWSKGMKGADVVAKLSGEATVRT